MDYSGSGKVDELAHVSNRLVTQDERTVYTNCKGVSQKDYPNLDANFILQKVVRLKDIS